MISAVIITRNEEENIKGCLDLLDFCGEIIVMDDYSQDKTADIAKELGAKVYRRSLNDNFAGQRNFGLGKAKGEWVLFIDADERVPKKLVEEIKKSISDKNTNSEINGFYLKRHDYVFGKWLKHGETGRIKLLRLGKRKKGKWERSVHEVWKIKGKVKELNTPLLHYPHKNVAHFLNQLNTYTSLHAKVLADEGKKSGFIKIVAYPMAKFFRNFIFLQGFRDGFAGLLHAAFMSLHSFLAQAKLWLLVNDK